MINLELDSSQVLPQVSTYHLAVELYRRIAKTPYVSLKLIELMEEYTDNLREAYASMDLYSE